ncbi:hypothetical protein FW755_06160 [Lonepinella koalarum]|uniref:DAPG hydrolase PhiG domain-containing protein n=1 Tax=Lonepinella koalarum TaxID=53417 RepID=A0A4R1KZY9_9PAST|nr:hypothetical protein [Lonepinella koalarum]MDH2926027.1 hypothetical protein [Lonepinella koalarum]TCK71178.1 hypothetical protein EV692_0242 [Lonepinella koalarum]TFJ90906.1 hypothetical protein E0709_01210 [Lonepinella koalarum]TYG34694.1 hypothetical protein FW755_06160 [Lonepinella koalarum]
MTKQVQTLNGLWVTQPELTEAERNSPLYKYYEQPLAPVAPELVAQIKQIDAARMLRAENLNDLLNDGYLDTEIGYCLFEDGTGCAASMVQMPDVTAEMLDWWFCWHTVEPMRYKIWDNKVHVEVRVNEQDSQRLQNTIIPAQERLWTTTHTAVEDIGTGVQEIEIEFQSPADFGFDVARFTDKAVTGILAKAMGGLVKMGHIARPHANGKGIELRTRFWVLAPQTPLEMVRCLSFHAMEEYTNLAAILPKVYAEFGHLPIEQKLVNS